ncbi:MAG: hypothetical protein GY733_15625 [bacterium]|nr:hypothetical protein [bacterium]
MRVATYSYDFLNRRVTTTEHDATAGDRTTRFYYDRDHAIREDEDDGTSVTTTWNYYGESIDDILAREVDGSSIGLLYYHKDATASVGALTSTAGEVVERYRYSPFGEVTVLDDGFVARAGNASVFDNPFLFQARRLDSTGLYYFRDRYFDPYSGRFLERDEKRDPLNYGSLFAFAGNNPSVYRDPWGLSGAAEAIAENLVELGEGMIEGAWDAITSYFDWGDMVDLACELGGIAYDLVTDFEGTMHRLLEDLQRAMQGGLCFVMNITARDIGRIIGGLVVEAIVAILTAGASMAVTGTKIAMKVARGVKALKKLSRHRPRVQRKRNASHPERQGCPDRKTTCFAAGTLVLVVTGFVPIEDIQVGDAVVSSAAVAAEGDESQQDAAVQGLTEKSAPAAAGPVGDAATHRGGRAAKRDAERDRNVSMTLRHQPDEFTEQRWLWSRGIPWESDVGGTGSPKPPGQGNQLRRFPRTPSLTTVSAVGPTGETSCAGFPSPLPWAAPRAPAHHPWRAWGSQLRRFPQTPSLTTDSAVEPTGRTSSAGSPGPLPCPLPRRSVKPPKKFPRPLWYWADDAIAVSPDPGDGYAQGAAAGTHSRWPAPDPTGPSTSATLFS